jgi:hypothetical protein
MFRKRCKAILDTAEFEQGIIGEPTIGEKDFAALK